MDPQVAAKAQGDDEPVTLATLALAATGGFAESSCALTQLASGHLVSPRPLNPTSKLRLRSSQPQS